MQNIYRIFNFILKLFADMFPLNMTHDDWGKRTIKSNAMKFFHDINVSMKK